MWHWIWGLPIFSVRKENGVGSGSPGCGSNRAAMIDLLIKSGTENRPELLHKYPWPARDPNGRINTESMLDMQAWYVKAKMSNMQFPKERLVNTSYAEQAVAKLGPFTLENKGSLLPGCR